MGVFKDICLDYLFPKQGVHLIPVLVVTIACMTAQVAASMKGKRECHADPNGSHTDPNNIYKCLISETCCQEGGQPSCCRKKDQEVATWEQVELWATLFALIAVLAFVMWYCRHDGDCCGNKKGQDEKSGGSCCCGGSKDDSDMEDGDDDDDDIEKVRYADPKNDSDNGNDDDKDNVPPAFVYHQPDEKHTTPDQFKKYDEVPPEFRDIDVEMAD